MALVGATAALASLQGSARAVASTIYVDNGSGFCTDSGSGAQSAPYCTIGKAASVAQPGQTVEVAAGTYPENVIPKYSGAPSAPIVYRAAPGASVTVSGQIHGFTISSRRWITIQGFTVTKTSGYGIYVTNSSNITVSGNDVSYSGQPVSGYTKYGIKLAGTTSSLVSGNSAHDNTDAGIFLDPSTSGVEVTGNVTFRNARGYARAAPGIDVRGGPNTIDRNVSHDNEDSGLQFYKGAHDNLVVDNVSYDNGDHGIDDLGATGQTIVSNSVYSNVTAGINVEGYSTGATLRNNISVDNGIGSPRTKGNIRVDANSISGTSIDSDLVYLSQSSPTIVWGSTSYSSLSAFQNATGQESHGLAGDPQWVNPGGGNFHLGPDSPAIDSADSGASGETSTDADGNPRVDDPVEPNTGIGPREYDDRGAYEFQP